MAHKKLYKIEISESVHKILDNLLIIYDYNGKFEYLQQRAYVPQRQKYLLVSPMVTNKIVDPCSVI